MKVNKELLKGSTSILILSILKREPMYGYQIIKELEQSSGGVFNLKEGTLYPILHSLEYDDLVESFWEESESKRKRKYYRLTTKGTNMLEERTEEWKTFRTAVDLVLEVKPIG